jgi:hypothetical protein
MTDVHEGSLANGRYLFIVFEITVKDKAKIASRFGRRYRGGLKLYCRRRYFRALLRCANEKVLCFGGVDSEAVGGKPVVDGI